MTTTENIPSQTKKAKKAKVGIELRLMKMMQNHCLQPAEMPIADGKKHQINDIQDKPRTKNIWYVLHKNGSGCFCHWSRTFYTQKFNFNADCTFTPKEINQIAKVQVKILAAEASDTKKRNELFRERSRWFFENADEPSSDHNYLIQNNINAYGIKQAGPCLIIPMYNSYEMIGLQFIQPDGKKWFAPGSEEAGAYFRINGKGGIIYIAESYSTAATIYELTGSSVVVAFDCENVEAVAKVVDVTHPNCDLLIWVDKDYLVHGHPGLTNAIAAARATGAKLAGPAFPTGIMGTDFTDMATSCCKGGA